MHQTEIGEEASVLVGENVERQVGSLDDRLGIVRRVHADSHRLDAEFGQGFNNGSEPAKL